MSGWALFEERPKLRGKRKKRADSGLNESGPELKKQRVSGDLGYGDDPEMDVMQEPIDTNEREGMETGVYPGFSEAKARQQEKQVAVNSGSRYNNGQLTEATGIDLSTTNIQSYERGLRHTVQGPNCYMEDILMPNE